MNRVFISKLLGGIALLITFLFVMSINLNNWFFKPTSARAGNTQPLQAVNWPKVSLVKIAGGFSQPTAIVDAGDHSGRLFITEQPGTIHILSLQSGTMLPTPFLDIRDRVQFQAGSEQGLLGLAFPPNYASKGYFYVYYTQKTSKLHRPPK
jgi:glucose/arabinose dehydrogenase